MHESFSFQPSSIIPFHDKDVCGQVRRIKRADLEKHRNPELRIRVMPDEVCGG